MSNFSIGESVLLKNSKTYKDNTDKSINRISIKIDYVYLVVIYLGVANMIIGGIILYKLI